MNDKTPIPALSATLAGQPPTIEQVEALHEEAMRLQSLVAVLQAPDTRAEIEKARRLSEHAQRRTRELNEDIARSNRRADWNERQLQRCCVAVGVANPSKVPAAIAAMRAGAPA